MKENQKPELTKKEEIGLKIIYKISDLIDYVVMLIFALLLFYGGYAMWDSNQIYKEAETKQYETYRPSTDDSLSFEELKEINSDVFSWLTVYGTNIDYPVVRGKDNTEYLNKNISGDFSLSGSIYLDYRNELAFTDFNHIIYGHHMDKGKMFGDIDSFLNESFFNEHQYGNLFYAGEDHGIEFFAYIKADAYDWTLYNPKIEARYQQENYLEYIASISLYYRDIGVTVEDRIILLSTCASLETNGRYVLVGKIVNQVFEDEFYEEKSSNSIIGSIGEVTLLEYIKTNKMAKAIAIIILLVLLLIIIYRLFVLKRKLKERYQKIMRRGDANDN